MKQGRVLQHSKVFQPRTVGAAVLPISSRACRGHAIATAVCEGTAYKKCAIAWVATRSLSQVQQPRRPLDLFSMTLKTYKGQHVKQFLPQPSQVANCVLMTMRSAGLALFAA
eukprot:3149003-Amphidinium_carterae.1